MRPDHATVKSYVDGTGLVLFLFELSHRLCSCNYFFKREKEWFRHPRHKIPWIQDTSYSEGFLHEMHLNINLHIWKNFLFYLLFSFKNNIETWKIPPTSFLATLASNISLTQTKYQSFGVLFEINNAIGVNTPFIFLLLY